MVIVLLALIFAGDGSLGRRGRPGARRPARSRPRRRRHRRRPCPASPSPAPSASVAPAPTPTPVPRTRCTARSRWSTRAVPPPSRRSTCCTTTSPTEDDAWCSRRTRALDVRRFTWSPDGTVGAGLLADVLVSIEPGKEKRDSATDLATLTFGRRCVDGVRRAHHARTGQRCRDRAGDRLRVGRHRPSWPAHLCAARRSSSGARAHRGAVQRRRRDDPPLLDATMARFASGCSEPARGSRPWTARGHRARGRRAADPRGRRTAATRISRGHRRRLEHVTLHDQRRMEELVERHGAGLA